MQQDIKRPDVPRPTDLGALTIRPETLVRYTRPTKTPAVALTACPRLGYCASLGLLSGFSRSNAAHGFRDAAATTLTDSADTRQSKGLEAGRAMVGRLGK